MSVPRRAVLATLASLAVTAQTTTQAAADPVQVLEQVGFFGRWSQHCEREPAQDNVLRTSWVADGIARFHEQNDKDGTGNLYSVLDAARIADDRVSMRIKLNGEVTLDLVMVVDHDRIRTMSNRMVAAGPAADRADAGRVLVKDGRVTGSRATTPWLTRCK
jgi:hypothetical protein